MDRFLAAILLLIGLLMIVFHRWIAETQMKALRASLPVLFRRFPPRVLTAIALLVGIGLTILSLIGLIGSYIIPFFVIFLGLWRLGLRIWVAVKQFGQEEASPGEPLFWLQVGGLESIAVLLLGVYLFLQMYLNDYHSLVLVYMSSISVFVAVLFRLGHWLSVRIKPRVDTELLEAAKAAAEVLERLAQRSDADPGFKEGGEAHKALEKLHKALSRYKHRGGWEAGD